MTKKILEMKLPNWVRNVCYTLMFLETVLVVIIYHTPELFIKIVMQFV